MTLHAPTADAAPPVAVIYDATEMLQSQATAGAYQGFMDDLTAMTKKDAAKDSVVTKYPSGKVRYVAEEIHYDFLEKDVPYGAFTEYYESGRIKRKGTAGLYGFYEGKYVEYYDAIDPKTKKQRVQISGDNNYKTGVHSFTKYHPNGQLELKAKKNRGYPEYYIEPFTEYYPDGKVKSVGKWDEQKKYVKYYESFHRNGKPQTTAVLTTTGETIGEVKSLYADGKLEYKYDSKADPFEPGAFESHWPNGKLKCKGMKDRGGRFSGAYELRSETGVVLVHGTADNYYPDFDGKLLEDGSADIGYKGFTGRLITRYPNDQIKLIRDYVSDKDSTGYSLEYYPNGQIMEEGRWNRYYGFTGGAYSEYWPNGQIKRQGTMLEGDLTGDVEAFYESGAPKYKYQTNSNGRLIGYEIYWHENGAIKYEAQYNQSGKFKRSRSFDENGKSVGERRQPSRPSKDAVDITLLFRQSHAAFGRPGLREGDKRKLRSKLFSYEN